MSGGASLTSEAASLVRAVLSGLDDLDALLPQIAAGKRGTDPRAVHALIADARERLRLACVAAGTLPGSVRLNDSKTPEVSP